MTSFKGRGPLKRCRHSPRLGTHGRHSSSLLRIRPPVLPTELLPGRLLLLCLLLFFESLGSGCLHLFGLVFAPFFSLAQLTGVEPGVALTGMLLANEEMMAEAGGRWSLPALRTMRNDKSAFVAASRFSWHGSVLPAMSTTIGDRGSCWFLVFMSHPGVLIKSYQMLGAHN